MAKAILFIHGFLGCKEQFSVLANSARGLGHAAEFITLPGHGGDAATFRAASEKDWQNAVDQRIEELRAQYDEILLCTHSMGGLLAIRSAIRSSEKIRGILALMLPLRIHITKRALKLWLCIPRPVQQEEEPFLAAARKSMGVTLRGYSDACSLLPGTLALLRLIRKARKSLADLAIPITVISSRWDEIVSPRTEKELRSRLPAAKLLQLSRSSHFCFAEEELPLMVDAPFNQLVEIP
ncbi:MAG: alpha/beta fold hydrolase [Clostridia bacterium]|nr:alpha/beta fold hydrolase [Clostridia bacterium]